MTVQPLAGDDTAADTDDWQTCEASIAWGVELDRLELELTWTERMLSVARPLEPTGWTANDEVGPIPTHLVPRARQLQARQQELISRLTSELRQLARVQRLVAQESHHSSAPRFLDASA